MTGAVLSVIVIALQIASVFLLLQMRNERGARGDLERLERGIEDEFARNRSEMADQFKRHREESTYALQSYARAVSDQSQKQSESLRVGYESVSNTLNRSLHNLRVEIAQELTRQASANEEQLRQLRETVVRHLTQIEATNAEKLEQMRITVDEKLHATLEARLGSSFELVSKRLEEVHKGLGEMQALAGGVGDLKRIMANVKVRGTWGEVQLGNLLDQILTREQYAQNVAVNPDSADRVEFAITLPGKGHDDKPVWLPIDAKFPLEDFQRLLDAQEAADVVQVEEAAKSLERRIRDEADTIAKKYIVPPFTTDFALMFVPTEGLYAELIRRPMLLERLQKDYRVILTGPTTLGAILNSLQMGFRTLAIEQRSSEVWATLGAVKTEFAKFGDTIEKVRKKIEAAGQEFNQVETRTKAINRKLKSVEELQNPAPTFELLGD